MEAEEIAKKRKWRRTIKRKNREKRKQEKENKKKELEVRGKPVFLDVFHECK